MILLYIWVQQFRNILDQGFCLSNILIVKGERLSLSSFRLHIRVNQNHLTSFYGSHIKDLKAIIAENGAGKSNLLDFIRGINSNHTGNTPFVAVYLTDNKKIYVRSSFNHIDLDSDVQFSNVQFPIGATVPLYNADINEKLPMLFYSGIIDIGNPRHSEENGDINISCSAELTSLAKDKRFIRFY